MTVFLPRELARSKAYELSLTRRHGQAYYHRINPRQGFACQRVYTDDPCLDEMSLVEDDDVVMVPEGYHPVSTTHGYDL